MNAFVSKTGMGYMYLHFNGKSKLSFCKVNEHNYSYFLGGTTCHQQRSPWWRNWTFF